MNLASISFLLYFFPLFLAAYAVTPEKYRKYALCLGSVIFYTMGTKEGILVLSLMTFVNYFLGLKMTNSKPGRRNRHFNREISKKNRLWMTVGVAVNVGVLMLYKFGFTQGGLPLGISFYTFQNISYLIDVFRRPAGKEPSLANYAAYVLFFPKLTSGPITRYGDMREELQKPVMDARKFQSGLGLFTVGLSYKVLLADRLGILWRDAQNIGYESLSTAYVWIAAVAYSMRLYFDFYGYSLMAVGAGKMLGITLPENFNHPYMARGVRDFYRRWHITLGAWFRDYVYIPLGGSRNGEGRTVLNLLIVWLLTGLWHGESLNFLVWGGVLFVCIVMERLIGKIGAVRKLKILPHLYLWVVIPVTWMCFAVTDVKDLTVLLGRMFGVMEGINVRRRDWMFVLKDFKYYLLFGFLACTPLLKKIYRKLEENFFFRLLLAVLFWLCVRRISLEGNNPFMYFIF